MLYGTSSSTCAHAKNLHFAFELALFFANHCSESEAYFEICAFLCHRICIRVFWIGLSGGWENMLKLSTYIPTSVALFSLPGLRIAFVVSRGSLSCLLDWSFTPRSTSVPNQSQCSTALRVPLVHMRKICTLLLSWPSSSRTIALSQRRILRFALFCATVFVFVFFE